MKKSMNYVEVDELERLLQEDSSFMLIDARTPEEFAARLCLASGNRIKKY